MSPGKKIWRLAGVDHLHVNGLANKFSEADDSVIASARACLTPNVCAKTLRGDAGVLLGSDGCVRRRARSRRSARPT